METAHMEAERNTTSRRQRVLDAIDMKSAERVPKDLGAMASTGISCFAYPKLRETLGLLPRLPRVFDTGQMLALPDPDVLDALDCDCLFVRMNECTNAFDEPKRWHKINFAGRLPALVMNPAAFETLPDGSVRQDNRLMVPGSYVFDAPHGGQPLDLSCDPPREDLDALRRRVETAGFPKEKAARIEDYCRKARAATDRAIMFTGLNAGLGFRGGIASYSMLCMIDPDYIAARHEILTDIAVRQVESLLPAIASGVDILMLSANDQGTQNAPILPPTVYRDLFAPFFRKVNDACHRVAPGIKTFLHSCGAVYELIDHIIDAGFDILNPVQWSAGNATYREWKEKARGRIALWGGGVNTQSTLPLGTTEEVEQEVADIVQIMKQDSGYIFCAIHNLLAEIPPEKIVAMYRAAS